MPSKVAFTGVFESVYSKIPERGLSKEFCPKEETKKPCAVIISDFVLSGWLLSKKSNKLLKSVLVKEKFASFSETDCKQKTLEFKELLQTKKQTIDSQKIAELRYDYDLLKNESILSSCKKPKVTESRAVIRNLERSKKSIFSSITSSENAGNFSLTNTDFNNLFDFLLNSHPDNTKSDIITAQGFLVSSFGQNSLDSPRSGILLYTDSKTPVKATLDGIVIYTGADDILSKVVIIYHSDYTFTTYGNLFEIKVKRLQRVSKGEIVALGGNEEFPSVFYQKDFLFIPQNPF